MSQTPPTVHLCISMLVICFSPPGFLLSTSLFSSLCRSPRPWRRMSPQTHRCRSLHTLRRASPQTRQRRSSRPWRRASPRTRRRWWDHLWSWWSWHRRARFLSSFSLRRPLSRHWNQMIIIWREDDVEQISLSPTEVSTLLMHYRSLIVFSKSIVGL